MNEPEVCNGHLCKIRYKRNEATDEHPCPYQDFVNGRKDYRCTCCKACEQNCRDDV